MEAVRIEQLVKPYYLQMMRLNALQYADDLVGALRLTGRTVSSGEVVELLGRFWRERVMGAWFSLLCDDDELVLAAVLQALRTSFGSLDAPPLIVAAVVLGGSASAPAIEHYLRRDVEQNWGASGFARAACDALDGQTTDEPVTTSDRADFEALLKIAQRLRSG